MCKCENSWASGVASASLSIIRQHEKDILSIYCSSHFAALHSLSLVKAKWRGRQQTPLWNVVYKVCEGKVMDFSFTQPKWAQREAAENRETFSHTEKLTSERESRKWIDNFITSHSHMWDRWKSVNGMCQRLTVQLCESFGAPKSHFPTHSAHPRCVYTKRIFHMYSYIVSHYHRLCTSFWGIASFGVGDFYTHSTTLVKRERERKTFFPPCVCVRFFRVFLPAFPPFRRRRAKKKINKAEAFDSCFAVLQELWFRSDVLFENRDARESCWSAFIFPSLVSEPDNIDFNPPSTPAPRRTKNQFGKVRENLTIKKKAASSKLMWKPNFSETFIVRVIKSF